jgi:NADH dehydrogenase
MSIRVVTVFGGTGFLGRRVVRHLREHEFSVRIASRHPDRNRKNSLVPMIRVFSRARPTFETSGWLPMCWPAPNAAVNAVSLDVER